MRNCLAVLIVALAMLSWIPASSGQHHGYRVLHTDTGHHGHWVSPGRAYPVNRASYAWGWFGATRHTTSSYHNGYYGWYWKRTDH